MSKTQPESRGRRIVRHGMTAMNVAQKALKVALITKSLLNVEFKKIDSILSLTPTTAGTVTWLTLATQGTGQDNRVGDSIKAKSIQVNVFAEGPVTAPACARLIFFRDKASNGVLPTTLEVLKAASITSHRNADYMQRFKVYKDMYLPLSPDGVEIRVKKWFKQLNFDLKYKADAGAITDAATNHLFLLYIVNVGASGLTVKADVRVRFIDN